MNKLPGMAKIYEEIFLRRQGERRGEIRLWAVERDGKRVWRTPWMERLPYAPVGPDVAYAETQDTLPTHDHVSFYCYRPVSAVESAAKT